MATFEKLRQHVASQADRAGYALRRRNSHPYGWELQDPNGDVPASGQLPDLESWLAEHWANGGGRTP